MAIVWAVPVRPDQLGYALSRYAAKTKKRFLALDRFHRYSTINGNDWARLPPEIVNMVTQYVLESESESAKGGKVQDREVDEQTWLQGYLCSQNACEPCQHIDNDIREEYAADFDKEFGLDNFDHGDPFPWEEDESGWTSEEDDEYDDEGNNGAKQAFLEERSSSVLLTERGGGTRRHDQDWKQQITDWILEQDEFEERSEEIHNSNISEWLELFDQKPGKNFEKLDKVCVSPPAKGIFH
jgi:hypothetical protein